MMSNDPIQMAIDALDEYMIAESAADYHEAERKARIALANYRKGE